MRLVALVLRERVEEGAERDAARRVGVAMFTLRRGGDAYPAGCVNAGREATSGRGATGYNVRDVVLLLR